MSQRHAPDQLVAGILVPIVDRGEFGIDKPGFRVYTQGDLTLDS